MLSIIYSIVFFLQNLIFIVDEDIDGIPLEKMEHLKPAFVPSKWETVDPEQIEAQAITTSKWDTLEPVAPEPPLFSKDSDDSNDDIYNTESSRDLDEDKRSRLREIEIKTVQYQDELESGKRGVKSGWTIHQQTEHYRRKLLKKSDKERAFDNSDSASDRYQNVSSRKKSLSPVEVTRKSKKSKRSPSPVFQRSSPTRSSKSLRRSRSPYARRTKEVSESPPPVRISK